MVLEDTFQAMIGWRQEVDLLGSKGLVLAER